MGERGGGRRLMQAGEREPTRGLGACYPGKILNFKSSEMARNGSKTVLALVVR